MILKSSDHFKLPEMLESQIISVVSTHAMKGVYSYINAQIKSPIAWDSSTCVPQRNGIISMYAE